jgi:hypothetical protein
VTFWRILGGKVEIDLEEEPGVTSWVGGGVWKVAIFE